MANQDPQPELYTTRHSFTGATAVAGDTSVQTVFTNQANNEEVRIYAVQISILDQNDAEAAVGTADINFALTIGVGSNNVPSNQFDLTAIQYKDDKTLAFPCPILVLFQQPLTITVELSSTAGATLTADRQVVITLIGELAIQKLPEFRRGRR